MDSKRLSYLLDTMIDDLLAQRRLRLQTHNKVILVVLSGEDLTTLPATLTCLTALHHCGYSLVMAFSHSARQSSLQSSCLEALAQRGIDVVCSSTEEPQMGAPCSSVYFPALSTNSLSKIALGIRDNMVCCWAFYALSMKKKVIVTLNSECLPDKNTVLPQAFRTRLANYVSSLAAYGFTVIGQPGRCAQQALSTSAHKPLVTLSDVRHYQQGQTLYINNRTIITPAARDEIRERDLIIVQSHQEDTCIWQR